MADTTSARFGAPLYSSDDSDEIEFSEQVNAITQAFDDKAARVTSGLLSDIPSSGVLGDAYYATDAGYILDWNGSVWMARNPPFLSTLPASPYDGQEAVLAVTNGISWRFRYNAGSSLAYKWEFIGGGPLIDEHDDTSTLPSITVPRAGNYVARFSADLEASATTFQWFGAVGLTVNGGSPPKTHNAGTGAGGPGFLVVAAIESRTFAKGDVLSLSITGAGESVGAVNKTLEITPQAVS